MALGGAVADGGGGVEGGTHGDRHLPVGDGHVSAPAEEETPDTAAPHLRAETSGLCGAITGWEWALIVAARPEVRRGPRACRM
jgi:hypothetical protein